MSTGRKQLPRHRAWCFTLNNYSLEDIEEYKMTLSGKDVKYGVFQLEKGENGTPHIQGYVNFHNGRTFKTVKRILGTRVHLDIARGTAKQNKEYCTKTDTRVDGPFEYGELPIQGNRTDLLFFQDTLEKHLNDHLKVIEQCPTQCMKYYKYMDYFFKKKNDEIMRKRPLEKWVCVLYGPTGTGKTRHVYDNHDADDIYVVQQGTGSQNSLWFDGYTGQSVVLIDDFRGNIMFKFLLNLLDRYPLRVQVKGGTVLFNPNKIYITSNHNPSQWYKKKGLRDYNALFRRFNFVIKVRSIDYKMIEHEDGKTISFVKRDEENQEVAFNLDELDEDNLFFNKDDLVNWQTLDF